MGTNLQVLGAKLVLLLMCSLSIAQQDDAQQSSVEGKTASSHDSTQHPRLISLKHRRYKSVRDNITSSHERIALPTTIDQSESHAIVHPDYDLPPHHHHHSLPPNIKSARNGFQLQKSPPDLQFGLAFTVPFISLSTEKLLNTVSGKNYDSVSSLLKLNFSGLFLAALVGLVAAAAIFLPSFLNHGGIPPPWLDGIIPHFTEPGYNDYGSNGWGDKGTWKDYNKDYGRRNGRAESAINAIGVGMLKLVEKFKSGVSNVEKCVVQRVCEEHKHGTSHPKKTSITELVKGISDNDVVKDVGVVKVIRKVIDGDTNVCGKVEALEICKEFSGIEESFLEILNGWREKGEKDTKNDKP